MIDQLAGMLAPGSLAPVVVMEPGRSLVATGGLHAMGAGVFSADIPAGMGREIGAQGQREFEALLKQRKGDHCG